MRVKEKEQEREREGEEEEQRMAVLYDNCHVIPHLLPLPSFLLPQAIRQSMASVVPQEPAPDCTEKISTLRIRLPDGSTTQRRFLSTHTLQVSKERARTQDWPGSSLLDPSCVPFDSTPSSSSSSSSSAFSGPPQLFRIHGLPGR